MNNGVKEKSLADRLLQFRSQIERANQANRVKSSEYARGIAVITHSLLKTLDSMFNPDTLKGKESIHSLIEKYCYPTPQCPICNTEMTMHLGRYGSSIRCAKFPDCGGKRHTTNKYPIINDALKLFLTQKQYEESIDMPTGRFTDLEL